MSTIVLVASIFYIICHSSIISVNADDPFPWGDWEHYHNYTEVVNTLLYLNETYSQIVDVFSIGKSWQNRHIYCVRLTNESDVNPKPKVFFVGYHHARELITSELTLYFTVHAVTNYGLNETITHIINHCEIFIVPALNVDGFEAAKRNEWQRKNACPIDEDNDGLADEDPPDDEDGDGYVEDLFYWDGNIYYFIRWEGIDDDNDGAYNEDWVGGVDLNRNYGYAWEQGNPNPDSEIYRGSAPFSEPETQAIRSLALEHNFTYAISFHSGTELILYPWGCTRTPPPDEATFIEIAQDLSNLSGGTPYMQASYLYYSYGLWDDWMYANRSTYALTCEIYGNDSAFQYEPGPYPNTWWERGVFQYFNPDPNDILTVIERWLPTFTYIADKAITGSHDVAITNVAFLKKVVGKGFSADINVTVANKGTYSENFNVTLYVNDTAIQSQTLNLSGKSSTKITFTWNTSDFAKGNYSIKAVADVVEGETSTTDNTLINGSILVAKVGDIGGKAPPQFFECDGLVDGKDLALFLQCYKGTAPSTAMYLGDLGSGVPPRFFKCDEVVDGRDLSLFLQCYKGMEPTY